MENENPYRSSFYEDIFILGIIALCIIIPNLIGLP